MDKIGDGEQSDEFLPFDHRKPSHVLLDKDTGGLLDRGVRGDGRRVACHQEPELGLVCLAQEVFSRDDPDELPFLEDRDPGNSGTLQYLQDIIPVPRYLNSDHLGGHEIRDVHGFDGRTTITVFGEFETTNELTLPRSIRSTSLFPWDPITTRSTGSSLIAFRISFPACPWRM